MKSILVFVLTFVVAAAGATGAKVMMTKPAAASPSDSAKADSAKGDGAKADATREPSAAAALDTAIVASGEAAASAADAAANRAAAAPINAPINAPVAPAIPLGAPKLIAPGAKLSAAAIALADSAKAEHDAAPAVPPARPVVPDTAGRRVAKVFTSMDAKQAAKVLEHMTDGDVQIILGYVGVKPAAAIMAALPPERVATLSKLAMKGSAK